MYRYVSCPAPDGEYLVLVDVDSCVDFIIFYTQVVMEIHLDKHLKVQ